MIAQRIMQFSHICHRNPNELMPPYLVETKQEHIPVSDSCRFRSRCGPVINATHLHMFFMVSLCLFFPGRRRTFCPVLMQFRPSMFKTTRPQPGRGVPPRHPVVVTRNLHTTYSREQNMTFAQSAIRTRSVLFAFQMITFYTRRFFLTGHTVNPMLRNHGRIIGLQLQDHQP